MSRVRLLASKSIGPRAKVMSNAIVTSRGPQTAPTRNRDSSREIRKRPLKHSHF